MNAVHIPEERLLVKQDAQGSVIFLADTLTDSSLQALRPSSGEIFNSSLEHYHSSKSVSDAVAAKAVREFEKTYGGTAQLMQRLPRVIRQTRGLKLKKALHDQQAPQEAQKPALTLVPERQAAPKNEGYTARKHGDFWKVYDMSGASLAFTVTEQDAIEVLRSLSGIGQNSH